MNIRIIIEYIGTNYSGWAKQELRKTVQGEIEIALKKLYKKDIEIFASGRTDAGVHSFGQVANFIAPDNIEAENIKYALNQILPDDICILKSEKVKEDFHSRFSAKKKTYLYRIQNFEVKRKFEINRAYYVKKELDIEKMRIASKNFIGEHDFSAFKTEGSSAKTFVRNIYDINIKKNRDIIEIEVSGNGFLYNMVRIIVGTLIEIGKGKDLDIKSIIESKDRTNAGPTAPAHGLYLKEVYYGESYEK